MGCAPPFKKWNIRKQLKKAWVAMAKTGKGGAILFNSLNYRIEINGSSFIKTSAEEDAHSIYISSSEKVSITNCFLRDCGYQEKTFSILLKSLNYNFLNNIITFSNINGGCGCLYSNKTNQIIIKGNIFKNAKKGVEINQLFELADIENNTFDNGLGTFQVNCINIGIFNNSIFNLCNNTFKNLFLDGFFIKIFFNEKINHFTIRSGVFQSNCLNEYCLPIYIQNKENTNDFELTFDNCHFLKNNNKGKGGSSNQIKHRINFLNCHFIENIAEEKGGALCILTNEECLIENCVFIENKANKGSGAIYIETNSIITINSTKFERNGQKDDNNDIILINSSIQAIISITNCNFIDCKSSGHSIEIQSNTYSIHFEKVEFKSCGGLSIIKKSDKSSEIDINLCTFDSCQKCFNLDISTSSFSFNNNIMKNNDASEYKDYFGLINCNHKITSFEIKNMTFYNNSCKSLYGGGIGLIITGINKLLFTDCKFVKNTALQDLSQSRSIGYFNGDGGGIQLGYSSLTRDIDVVFQNCQFKENYALSHGGAISIQTLKTVEIINCEFEQNEANNQTISSQLLFEDHFTKKFQGRGGAIYINPGYEISSENFMKSISIKNCKFKSNKAYDGFSIYIEGDEKIATHFTIESNEFIDNYHPNYNSEMHSILTTEILSISREMIQKNSFIDTESKITAVQLHYVDHYGIPLNMTRKPGQIPNDFEIPISIPMSQLISNGNKSCKTQNSCPSNIISTFPCGEFCMPDGNHRVYFEYTFKGEGFQVYGSYDNFFGHYMIYLDNEYIATIDQYSDTKSVYELQFTSDILSYKEHTIKLISYNNLFEIYKITYWPSLNAKRLNITKFEKTGIWINESDEIGGIRQYSKSYAYTAHISNFKALKFWIYGTKSKWNKKVRINYDDFEDEFDEHEINGVVDRMNSFLVYESPNFTSTAAKYNLILTTEGTATIDCIYYIYNESFDDNEISASSTFMTSIDTKEKKIYWNKKNIILLVIAIEVAIIVILIIVILVFYLKQNKIQSEKFIEI